MSARIRLSLLAGAVAATLAAPVSAVRLSPDGTGQVLLFPYYTTRAGFATSVSVVNHDFNHTKAVKVRWREARIGAPVLDLNIFLSPRDIWSAVVTDDGSGARLTTSDRTCTNPAVPTVGLPFVNSFYTGQAPGTFNDNGGAGLDRTREGYVEIIEMGVVANGSDFVSFPATPQGNTVAAAVKHNAAGVPSNCAAARVTNLFAGAGDLRAPDGGLSAQAIIINSANGTEFALEPTALQHFFRPTAPTTDLYTEPGSLLPDLTSVSPARSDVVVTESTGSATPAMVTVNDWVAAGGQPIDAVSAVLMKNKVAAEYDISDGIKTEIVLTMPTKRHYVLPPPGQANPAAFVAGPFTETFFDSSPLDLVAGKSCDPLFAIQYDRERAPYGISGAFSLQSACAAASVFTLTPPGISATASSIFASINATSFAPLFSGPGGSAPQFTAGWISLAPTRLTGQPLPASPGQSVVSGLNAVTEIPLNRLTLDALGGLRNLAPVHTDGVARRYRGLPMIGFFALQARIAGQGYGGIFPFRAQTVVEP